MTVVCITNFGSIESSIQVRKQCMVKLYLSLAAMQVLAMKLRKIYFNEVRHSSEKKTKTFRFSIGARVVLFCRDMNKGRRAVQQLCSQTKCDENNLRLIECDLCSFDSVRNAAKLYNEEEDRLDVLICNAGLAWAPNVVTKDGFNSVVQANYLGHFLLTNLLLDKLKQCRPSRILNVSSDAHRSVLQRKELNIDLKFFVRF